MENRLYIIRSEGTEHLCYKEDGLFVDICDDMFFFMEDADDFEVIPPGMSFSGKTYDYDGKRVRLIPRSYSNGLIALTLVFAETGKPYATLTKNLEDEPVVGLAKWTIIDTGNNPEAMGFLLENGLAKDAGHKYKIGFREYPVVNLDFPELYRVCPTFFEDTDDDMDRRWKPSMNPSTAIQDKKH